MCTVHVEYYFKGDGKYLTFPWDKGMTVETIEQYYDDNNFSDYTHALSRAPIIKAQHPDYEISQMGIHGQRGVSCADCHMPYKSEGGMKFSDHHIQSPLAMIDRTCQVCHRESEETLRNNVYERQRKANEIRNRLEQELIYYIEKLDVNEEKQRLGNHLKYFISTMESGNGQGKKLGFIAQEMGREINTLGSKSNHAEMQKIVVQMKDELEQIKEQVLNVM